MSRTQSKRDGRRQPRNSSEQRESGRAAVAREPLIPPVAEQRLSGMLALGKGAAMFDRQRAGRVWRRGPARLGADQLKTPGAGRRGLRRLPARAGGAFVDAAAAVRRRGVVSAAATVGEGQLLAMGDLTTVAPPAGAALAPTGVRRRQRQRHRRRQQQRDSRSPFFAMEMHRRQHLFAPLYFWRLPGACPVASSRQTATGTRPRRPAIRRPRVAARQAGRRPRSGGCGRAWSPTDRAPGDIPAPG